MVSLVKGYKDILVEHLLSRISCLPEMDQHNLGIYVADFHLFPINGRQLCIGEARLISGGKLLLEREDIESLFSLRGESGDIFRIRLKSHK